MAKKRIGDMLIEHGYIVQEQLDEALELQQKTYKGTAIGEVLVDIGFITEEQLAQTLGEQLGLEYVDLNNQKISRDLASAIPANIAKQNQIVPIGVTDDSLEVVMGDPTNYYAFDQLRKISHKKIVPMIATASSVERAVELLYEKEGVNEAIKNIVDDRGMSSTAIPSVFTLNQINTDEEDSAPAIQLVNTILEKAVLENASDIHVEPRESKLVIRMRFDGVMRSVMEWPKEAQMSIIARLKVMSGMDVVEKRVPQDGRFSVNIKDREVDLRVSTLPVADGEKVVVRLLDKSKTRMNKEQLGLRRQDMERYDRLLSYRNGVLLIVGPTGSGKSTTMYSMIGDLNTEDVNLVTLEDPIEYRFDGVNQVQINEKTNMTFNNGLVAILRQDPDIVSIGEIRDGETAETAMRAALTGRFVLSTMHTNDALGVVERLKDMGVEKYLIASTLRGVISQRLVRRICPHCKEEYVPKMSELEKLGMEREEGMTFAIGRGCNLCYNTGYIGRIAVFEILTMSAELKDLIDEGAGRAEMEKYLRESGNLITLRDNARELVKEKITTSSEILRVISENDD